MITKKPQYLDLNLFLQINIKFLYVFKERQKEFFKTEVKTFDNINHPRKVYDIGLLANRS